MADDLSPRGQLISAHPSRRLGPPRHFHLLWDEDLEQMRPIFEALMRERHSVIELWYQLYTLHFGDERTLSEAEFFRLFEPVLLRCNAALIEKQMEQYSAEMRALGERLARRGVPLQELIASLHLFEQAAQSAFPPELPHDAGLYMKFDQLSHIQIILLVDAYLRLLGATTAVRIAGLEAELNRVGAAERQRFYGLVGGSRLMRQLYDKIEAVARTNSTVLIVGETGTGKELVARAIHEASPRRGAPFIAFNCAAIPKDLVESELFGYRRGAFTGAHTEYLGLFRAAEGGTLFLDEITEMGAEAQSKLLRTLQEHTVRPIGSSKEMQVDVRVIASTNRDPEEAVRSGHLRQDLYYRLTAAVIAVPPLRERKDDIPLLVEHFIALYNEKTGRTPPITGIEQRALDALVQYDWPGNVRELANTIEGAFTFGRGSLITFEDLKPRIQASLENSRQSASVPGAQTFAEAERELIARALRLTGGNKLQAARMLRISRKKLYAKIRKYGLEEISPPVKETETGSEAEPKV